MRQWGNARGPIPPTQTITITLTDAELQSAATATRKLGWPLDQLATRLASSTGPLTPEELEMSARIAEVLDRVIEAVDDGVNWTDSTLERVKDWHARSHRILLLTAVGITVALVWIGLAQFSLMVHGYSWVRSRGSAAGTGGRA